MKKRKTGDTLLVAYGEHWPRTKDNIEKTPKKKAHHHSGIYVLYDGAIPMYIGKAIKGSICHRIKRHDRSKSKTRYWNNFSWYALNIKKDYDYIELIEKLILRILPYQFRLLNRQSAKFSNGAMQSPPKPTLVIKRFPKAFRNK